VSIEDGEVAAFGPLLQGLRLRDVQNYGDTVLVVVPH
jgi:hypothetical protein